MYLRLIYYYVDEDKMEQPTNANTQVRCESNLHIKDYQYYLLHVDTNIKSIFINFCNKIKAKMNNPVNTLRAPNYIRMKR